METSLFFKTYAKDKKKKECLKAFAECPKIVEWIKKVAKGKHTMNCVLLDFCLGSRCK